MRVFRDVDAALEWCEDRLLSNMLHQNAEPKFALSELDVFKGLNAEEYRLVETIVNPLIFENGAPVDPTTTTRVAQSPLQAPRARRRRLHRV